MEGDEGGLGPSLTWLHLCDMHGIMTFRLLLGQPQKVSVEGFFFFFILIESLGLSGWVQLSEGLLLARMGPLESRKSPWECVGWGESSPSVQLDRCQQKLFAGWF